MSSSTTPEHFPDAPIIALILTEYDNRDWNYSADALADWLNARWKKTGYSLSRQTIYEILKANGRVAFLGLGDDQEGKFAR